MFIDSKHKKLKNGFTLWLAKLSVFPEVACYPLAKWPNFPSTWYLFDPVDFEHDWQSNLLQPELSFH